MKKAVIAIVAIIAGFLLTQAIKIFFPSLVPGIRDVTLGLIILISVLVSIQSFRDMVEKTRSAKLRLWDGTLLVLSLLLWLPLLISAALEFGGQ